MLLSDRQLIALIDDDPEFIRGLDASTHERRVQASSVDLTVGKIYMPETPHGEPGSHDNPNQDGVILKPGHTVVVQTAERLSMPSDIAAFGFPPARMSRNGLLMTNPGHVDPGYQGCLSFTIINMGKADYELGKGDAIVTLLFLRLDGPAAADWIERGNQPGDRPVRHTTLDRLTHDFLQVGARAKAVADEAERETRRLTNRATWVSAFALVLIPLVTLIANLWVGSLSTVDRIDDRVKNIEQTLTELDFDVRLDGVEQQLADIIDSSDG